MVFIMRDEPFKVKTLPEIPSELPTEEQSKPQADATVAPISTIVPTPIKTSDHQGEQASLPKVKNQILEQIKIFTDESEEDSSRFKAVDRTFSLLMDYLQTQESIDDNLKWTGLEINIIPDSDAGRFIEVLADPFYSHTGGKADGHWLIYQYIDRGRITSSMLWRETNLIYKKHLRVQNKLIIVGNLASYAGGVFIGQWQDQAGSWSELPFSSFPPNSGILEQWQNLLYGYSNKMTRLTIDLKDSVVAITDDLSINLNLIWNPIKGSLDSQKKNEHR